VGVLTEFIGILKLFKEYLHFIRAKTLPEIVKFLDHLFPMTYKIYLLLFFKKIY